MDRPMHRVTLAHWHGGRAPGTEIDIDDDELRQLTRDGRVASVTEVVAVSHGVTAADPEESEADPAPDPDAEASEPEPEETETEAPPAKTRRRR